MPGRASLLRSAILVDLAEIREASAPLLGEVVTQIVVTAETYDLIRNLYLLFVATFATALFLRRDGLP